jgi:hypothetical protein
VIIALVVVVVMLLIASPVSAQGPTDTMTTTLEIERWMPAGGLAEKLEPLDFEISEDNQIIDFDADHMWTIGRVALTLYSLVGNNTWLTLLFLLLIPVILLLVYRLFLSPPDI